MFYNNCSFYCTHLSHFRTEVLDDVASHWRGTISLRCVPFEVELQNLCLYEFVITVIQTNLCITDVRGYWSRWRRWESDRVGHARENGFRVRVFCKIFCFLSGMQPNNCTWLLQTITFKLYFALVHAKNRTHESQGCLSINTMHWATHLQLPMKPTRYFRRPDF